MASLKGGLGRFLGGATGAGSDIFQLLLMQELGILGDHQLGQQGEAANPNYTQQGAPTGPPQPLLEAQHGDVSDVTRPNSSNLGVEGLIRRRLAEKKKEDERQNLRVSDGAYI